MLPWLLFTIAALSAAGASWYAWHAKRARGRAIDRLVQLRSELDRRLSELFALQELSYVLSNAIELDAIAEQASRFLERFIENDGTLVAVGGEADNDLTVVAANGIFADMRGTTITEAEAGVLSVAIHRNRVELVQRGTAETPPAVVAGHRVERAAVAPLHAHATTVGAIALARGAERAFGPEDLRLLTTVATHATIALTNARFVELIRLARDQWETTFDALDDGVAVVDEVGRIQRANAALARIVGRPIPEVVGQRLPHALIGPSTELAAFLDARRQGVAANPLVLRRPGRHRLLQLQALPMPDAAGWLVVVVQDITQRKAMEAQLIQTEKMAAVGQLVSGVAHELNNPLTSITGLAEFLMQQPDTTEREHIKVIHEQAERAARIVRNLLTFARKGPLDLGPLDLSDTARRVAALMSYELRLRKVELELDLPGGLPPVQGDRHQLQQVVLNLLSNAVQAVSGNPPERPRVVRVRTAGVGIDQVSLAVEDNGPGIPEQLVQQIFDPFFTTKDPGDGTGLGLSISFGIVEGHGGKIEVQRALGGGAAFVVTLPAAKSGSAAMPDSATAAEAPTEPDASSAEARILLVDDDPAVRRAISALFSQNGARVRAAPTAAEALDLLEEEPFDLIIADARAAVTSDETLADALVHRRPDLAHRTILLTADVRPETDEWLRKLGWKYFRKPFNVRELQAAARELLSG